MRYHLMLVKMAIMKKSKGNKYSNKEKRKTFCTTGGNVNCYSHYGKQYSSPQKIKNRTTTWSNNATSGYKPKGNKITALKKNLPLPHSLTALFTVAKKWTQLECAYTDHQMKKLGVHIQLHII